jgi:hypothetical protein
LRTAAYCCVHILKRRSTSCQANCDWLCTEALLRVHRGAGSDSGTMYRAPTEQEGKRAGLKPGLYKSLGEGLKEEGEHAVAGDVGEGGELEGVVAAGEFEGAGIGAVAAKGVEHLAG